MILPYNGAFSYNGVSFVSLYKSKVEVKPVKDSAGRALVAREYSIDVEGRIGGIAGGTDGTLAAMRIALEKPAGALVYTNKGFGPLQVNVPGGNIWDAAYGPWPEVLAWNPVGNNQGCMIRWKCTTQVPCEENPAAKGVIEYCWSESWDIDEHGFTSRTIEGHLTIQATRQSVNSRNVQDNADGYRAQVTPELPVGFRRTQNFKLSEDKRTLEFSFKDEQLPQPLLEGTTACEVTHRAKWSLPKAGNTHWLTSTISGTIHLPASTPRQYAWNKIYLILRSKWPIGGGGGGPVQGAALAAIQAIAAGGAGDANGKIPRVGPGATFFLQDIEISDEMFGNAVRFSATCFILPTGGNIAGPSQLLTSTGLWAPIPNTDFVRWKQSMFGPSGKAQGPRGMAGMGFKNGDDAIVDLCSRQTPPKGNPDAPGRKTGGPSRIPLQPNGGIILPQNTWIKCLMRLRLIEDDRIARHKPLSKGTSLKPVPPLSDFLSTDYQKSPGLTPPQDNQLEGFIGQGGSGPESSIGVQGPGYTGGQPDLLQQVSAPTQTIRLEGIAIRIGYPIPTPRLTTIGGAPVVQLRQDVSQEQISNIGGVPVYGATWQIDYALTAPIAVGLPMPINPAVE